MVKNRQITARNLFENYPRNLDGVVKTRKEEIKSDADTLLPRVEGFAARDEPAVEATVKPKERFPARRELDQRVSKT